VLGRVDALVRVRARFHCYSASNGMLLAMQCHERGIEPGRIAGFRTWLKPGRRVRQGETALRILAPITLKPRGEHRPDSDQRRVFFKTAFVFDVCQTELLDGVEPAALDPPRELLVGDSRSHLLAPLQAFAESLGYTVTTEPITGPAGAWSDPGRKRIAVDAAAPANATADPDP